jgi:hypothetical protein
MRKSENICRSYGNKSDSPRRATVLNFFRDGTISNTDEPLLDQIPVFPKGEKLQVSDKMIE